MGLVDEAKRLEKLRMGRCPLDPLRIRAERGRARLYFGLGPPGEDVEAIQMAR